MTSVIAPVWQELYVAALRNGDLPATAAAIVGTTQKQVDFWRTQSEEFDHECHAILEQRVDELENRAYELAMNSSTKTIYYKGDPVGEEEVVHKDLIMFMLKANRDKYNDKLITQSKVDHNITISINSFAPDPNNEREVIEGEYTHSQQPSDTADNPITTATRPSASHCAADAIQSPIEAYI